MANYNRVVLMGRLTRDVELRYTQSGLAVTDMGLAVNDRRKNQSGEWTEETTFVDVTLWGRTAEVASEYLSKGSPAFVEGRLKFDTWESDGQKRSKLRVVGERLQLIGSRGGGDQSQPGDGYAESGYGAPAGSAPAGNASGRPQQQPQPEDDIPF